MSLTEALFLDSYADTAQVWIANRGLGGPRGSGTQADPWNGVTIPYPEIPVSSITRSGLDATATTSSPHGFANGDPVTILGVSVIPPGSADVFFAGTFLIFSVTATSFKYTMGYGFGFGPTSASAPGSAITCVREREQLDTLLRIMPEGTEVILGPGVFDTKGMSNSVISWQPRSGQTIRGSGIGQTTLRLVGAAVPEGNYAAVGVHYYTFLHDFTISEMTIDANISNQLTPYVTCAAAQIQGRHIRIRRIRAINFGSQTQTYVENFVVGSGGTHPTLVEAGEEGSDCVIEDCIAERPTPNPINNSTIFHFFGGERPDGVTSYHRGCVIRNCFVNAQIVYGTLTPLPIASITRTGSTVKVTTKLPHLLAVPGNVVLSGVTVSGNPDNLFNGVFEVDALDSMDPLKTFTYKLTTADNPDASSGFVGGGVSTHPVSIDHIEWVSTDSGSGLSTYKIVTREPHGRTRNNNLRVQQVLKPDGSPTTTFNGNFVVADYKPEAPKELYYTLLQPPDVPPPTQPNTASAFVNIGHQALSADTGTAAMVEGNRVFHCSIGGPYHDTWPTKDLVVARNYYHDVTAGPFQNFGSVSSNPYPIALSSLDYDDEAEVCSALALDIFQIYDNSTGIAITSFPHGLSAITDQITISGANGADASVYNGFFRINFVPSPTGFQYDLAATATTKGVGAGYFTYEAGPPTVSAQRHLTALARIQRGTSPNFLYFGSATTDDEHGFSVGEWVRITKAAHFVNGSFETGPHFNGDFAITAVPDAHTFEYQILDQNGNPLDPGAGSPDSLFCAGYFGRIWQTFRLVIERNVIELATRILWPGGDPFWHGSGIAMYGNHIFPPAYSLRSVVIRSNIIRNVNDVSAPYSRAIELGGCEEAIIENNLIGVDRTTPIEHNTVGILNSFNNTKLDGTLVRSLATDGGTATTEVSDKVRADLDDAILAWF